MRYTVNIFFPFSTVVDGREIEKIRDQERKKAVYSDCPPNLKLIPKGLILYLVQNYK